MVSLMLFEICCLHEAGSHWIRIDKSFQDVTTIIDLTTSLLKLDKGIPSVLCRLPSHPVFENTSGALNFAEHFLHKSIFVPELVDPGQMFASALPNISC